MLLYGYNAVFKGTGSYTAKYNMTSNGLSVEFKWIMDNSYIHSEWNKYKDFSCMYRRLFK
jgi:hypothetical protein